MLYLILLLPLLLAFLSGALDGAMDTVDHHFNQSVFSRIKSARWRTWFNEYEGWRNKYNGRDPLNGRVQWRILGLRVNKPVQLCDSWHFFKMLRECCNAATPLALLYATKCCLEWLDPWWVLVLWAAFGVVRNTGFSLFYKKILLLKQYREKWLIF